MDDNTHQASLATIRISTDEQILDISFDSGPRDDPLFVIQINQAKETFSIEGNVLYISAGKTFYTRSDINKHYVQAQKFHLVDNKVVEIQQPFYLVDRDCTTSTVLAMYTQKCGKQHKVAVLPADARIKVLLAEYGKNTCDAPELSLDNEGNNMDMNFLVATSFGLVGWVSTSGGYLQRPGKPLSCIRYVGD